VHNRPDLWKRTLNEIKKKLNQYFRTGALKTISPSIIFSEKGIIPLVLSCQSDVKIYLEKTCIKDIKIDASIKAWWKYVHKEYPGYDSPFAPLAYIIILHWFNRFVFSNILLAYGRISISKPFLKADTSINEAIELFTNISSKTDFWSIIGPFSFDKLLPNSVWEKLLAIFNLLQDYDFAQIDKSILTEIIQSTVLLSIKKAAGLFSTPKNIAELLVRIALWDKDAPVIDPFCGTGTIVKSILEILGEYNLDGKTIVKNTWACDKFGFPVQIANLAIASPEIIDEPIQIFTHDAFDLYINEDIPFINPKDGTKFTKKLPIFGSIISNLPFVAFEDIAELNPNIYSKIETFYIKNEIKESDQLDGRSDLYCYIPFVILPLLKEGGILGIIISNSWLSTKAGIKFRRLLKISYDIEFVITSANGRWFSNTDVVTNILVLRKKNRTTNEENKTAFISTLVNLNANIDISDIALDIINLNKNSKNITYNQYSDSELERIEKLGIGLNACFGNCDWLINYNDKFIKFSSIADISRGERRGWDDLFYPDFEEAQQIEEDYIKKVYKTAKGSEYYVVAPDHPAFCCEKSISELEKLGHQGALNWITKFKNDTNEKGEPLPDVLKRRDMYWYEMPSRTLATFALSINPDRKICFYRFIEPSFVNQRLISISPNKFIDLDLLHALLNSIFVTSQIESLGFGRGLGVLDINASNIRDGLFIPNINIIDNNDAIQIKKLFKIIIMKPIIDTIATLDSPEWIEFNYKIAKSINLPTESVRSAYEHFSRIYTIRKSVGR